jgi:hypothetical protein
MGVCTGRPILIRANYGSDATLTIDPGRTGKKCKRKPKSTQAQILPEFYFGLYLNVSNEKEKDE